MLDSYTGRPSSARTVQTRRALLFGLSLPLLAGCGGPAESSAGFEAVQAVADTVDGIPRSTWPETPFPELAWRFDTLFVVGGYDAESSAYQFDQVEPGGIAGDPFDRLFVLDAAGKRLLGFGPDGRPIGSWGREGGGPGELNSPSGLGVGPGDSLWVVDRGNRRVTAFPPDPEGVPSDLALTDESSGLSGRLAVDPAGIVGMALTFSFRPGEEVEYPPRRLIRLARDGALMDTVWTSPPPMFDRIELTTGNQVAIMLTQRSFSPGVYWQRFGDGGFAVAEKAPHVAVLVIDQPPVLLVLHHPGLVDGLDRTQPHGHGGKLPVIGHEPGMGVGGQPVPVHLASKIIELGFVQPTLEVGARVHAGSAMALIEHQIARVSALGAAEKVIEADIIQGRAG